MKKRLFAIGLAGLTMAGMMLVAGTHSHADDGIAVNAANFPDAAFRTIIADYAGDDGILSSDEIVKISSLEITDSSVASLEGISNLTSLCSLYVTGTSVKCVDVSALHNLKTIDFEDNAKLYGFTYYGPKPKTITITGSPLLYFDQVSATPSGEKSTITIETIPYTVSGYSCDGFNLSDGGENQYSRYKENTSNVTGGTIDGSGKFIPDLCSKTMTYKYTNIGNVSFTAQLKLTNCVHTYGDDNICTICGLDSDGLAFLGNSVDISNGIILNFVYAIDPAIKDEVGFVTEIGDYRDGGSFSLTPSADDSNVYTLSVAIPAKDMATTVEVTGYKAVTVDYPVSDTQTAQRTEIQYFTHNYSMSIKDYVDKAISTGTVTDAKEIAFMKAMLKYGNAVQTYFGYNTGSPASDDTAYHAVTFLNQYSQTGVADTGMKFVGSALDVKSTTLLRYYIKQGTGDYAYIDAYGERIDYTITDNEGNTCDYAQQYLEKYDYTYFDACIKVGPQNLDNTYTFSSEDGVYSLSYGVFSYAARVQELAKTDSSYDKLLNVMYALYEYNTAADTYTGSTHHTVVE